MNFFVSFDWLSIPHFLRLLAIVATREAKIPSDQNEHKKDVDGDERKEHRPGGAWIFIVETNPALFTSVHIHMQKRVRQVHENESSNPARNFRYDCNTMEADSLHKLGQDEETCDAPHTGEVNTLEAILGNLAMAERAPDANCTADEEHCGATKLSICVSARSIS